MAIQTFTLTIRERTLDGNNPTQVDVVVYPLASNDGTLLKVIKDTAGEIVMMGHAVKRVRDKTGAACAEVTLTLPDPRDVTLNPTGFGFRVHLTTNYFTLPTPVVFGSAELDAHESGGVLYLEDVTEVDPAMFTALTSYVEKPTGGTDGQALVKSGSTVVWGSGGGGGTTVDASTTVKGIIELATNTEATTGTDTVRAVTPAGLKAAVDALIAGAPGALDTLNEIATQLSTDESAVSALTTTVGGKLAKASNLSDLANAGAARTNLGLGTAATQATTAFEPAGAVAAEATARNTAITTAINNLVAGAPGALDTLLELANQLTADESAATALTSAVAGKQALQQVATTVSASGAAVVNKHNPVDATAAARSISLPTGQAEGTQVSVEKVDSSANTVSITGSIRGVGSSTISLNYLSESLMLRADSAGSWWPIAGHRTKSSLDVAYAPKSLPGTITGTGRYDPARSTYNFKGTSLQKTRAQIAKAVAGTALCEILCVGPSTTEGFPGNTATESWPARLVTLLAGKGLPAGTGWVQTVYASGAGTDDARWTFSSMVKFTTFKSPLISSDANGDYATFTSTDKGSIIEWSIIGTWPAYSYQIDGGAVVPVTAGGGASQTTITTITGLDPTKTHTVKLLAGATGMFVQAARVRNATGIQVTNAGYGGSSTDEWDTTVDAPLGASRIAYGLQASSVARGVPHLVIIDVETMMNDLLVNAKTSAQSSAALTRVVGQYQARGCDVVMTWSAAPSATVAYSTFATVPDATYQTYRQIAYTVADALNVPFIDVPDRIGNWATANINGLMADALHPSPLGYAAIGATVEQALDLGTALPDPATKADVASVPKMTGSGITIPTGSLDRWKAARAQAKAGSILGEVLMYGDSTWWGQTNTGSATTGVGRYPLPQKLRALAIAAGFPDGGVGIQGSYGSTTASGADALALVSASTGTWTDAAGSGFYSPLRQYGIKNTSNVVGDSLTMQMKIPTGGGKIRINHTAGTPANTTAWTYAVDGGTATAATVQTTTRKTRTITLSGLSAGTHTLVIAITTAGAAAGGDEWTFEAIGNSGLTFQNYGIAGSRASARFEVVTTGTGMWQESFGLGYYEDMVNTTPTFPWMVANSRLNGAARNPVLALHSLGINDLVNSSTTFTTATGANDSAGLVAASIGAFAELTKPICDAIVVIPQLTWVSANMAWIGQFRDAMMATALSYGLPVIDMQYPLGYGRTNYTTYGSGVHLNSAGYDLQAQYLWDNLLNIA